MQISHEIAHCGRGEFLLFVLALFTAIQLFVVPNALLLARLDQENYYYYHITLNLLGLYVLWVGNEIMMRREHIADYVAHMQVGAPYLAYMKSRVPTFPIKVASRRKSRFRAFLATYFTWHPSWEERVEFVENARRAPAKGYWRMCGAAFALSAGSLFVAQFILSPENPVFQRVFGSFWNDDISPVGAILMIFILTSVGWLICSASQILRFKKWVLLTFFYCCGASVAQFSWLFSETTFLRDDDATSYEIMSFPAAYLCWFVYHLVLYLNFPMRRSPWTYGLYAGITLIFTWSGLGAIEKSIIELGYAINPAYWRALVVNSMFGMVMIGWCLLASCALDLTRLSLIAVKNRIWSRPHLP